MSSIPPVTQPGKLGKRLTPTQKQRIVRGITSGRTQKDVALELGVNKDTVHKVVTNQLGNGWRDTFTAALDPISATIVKSATDSEDVHKAANTGLKLFAGLGLLQGEGSQTNVLIQLNNTLPEDLRLDLVSTHDVIDVYAERTPTGSVSVPTNSAVDRK